LPKADYPGKLIKFFGMLGKSVIMQIITHESNHKKYDDTSKEIKKNQNEDSQKESY